MTERNATAESGAIPPVGALLDRAVGPHAEIAVRVRVGEALDRAHVGAEQVGVQRLLRHPPRLRRSPRDGEGVHLAPRFGARGHRRVRARRDEGRARRRARAALATATKKT